ARPVRPLGRRALRAAVTRAALALVAAAALAGCRASPPAVAPTPGVDALAYGAALRLDPEQLRLDGRVRVRIARAPGAGHVTLALDEAMRVRAVRVDGRPTAFTHTHGALVVPL